MEIIDVRGLGVRSAILRLRRKATPLRFTIYPMVHLGEPAFYAEIARRLRAHDLIIAEGLRGADKTVRRLTGVYRRAGGSERLGLVVQPATMVEVGVPVVWADMTAEEFGRRWQKVPLSERVLLTGTAPVAGLFMRVLASREFLARFLRVDDDTAIDMWDPDSGVDKLVGDEREALLIKALDEIYAQRHDEGIDVAIVYGAGHALPVVKYLMAALGYVVGSAEWVTVFDY
jgi:hypothetical protein